MSVFPKLFASFAMSAGVMLAASPSQAVNIALATGPFSVPANPSGVIPAGTFASGTNTYDFTFTILGGPFEDLLQLQASAIANGVPQPVAFKLYDGDPGSGVFVANSGGTSTAASLSHPIGPGDHFFEMLTVGAPLELVTGGMTLTQLTRTGGVPEPATWALSLLGIGALGATLRRRRAAA
jgi:hypothetical protein